MKEKIFEVAYQARSKEGPITKTIKVVAHTENHAVQQILDLNNCMAVYGATVIEHNQRRIQESKRE